ncbi:hypothetical protein SS37A_15780 [Methylocystis iwaonis]|uniref:Uncharacterized protein n=1 Tax=Methylocystis iwaonis TaxID=2885079 RepID=A0ABM8E7V9_9HYPH|nr:hypothetical protein SS37A_15780 [Methylocystis iwaonis]
MSGLPPTRPAARATLPVKGRDWSGAVWAPFDALMQSRASRMICNADAIPSLPFTGRVARAAGRVGPDPDGRVG